MIKPGEEWGRPTDAPADIECRGDDAALAATIAPTDRDLSARAAPMPAPLVRFHPRHSDLARAVGLAEPADGSGTPSAARGVELPIDAISTDVGIAMNSVVVGPIPTRLRAFHRRRRISVRVDGREFFDGRATTVVVANGQFVDGVDLVPRGHPGDGRLEVQVYTLNPGERGPMRRRLPTGTHLPHPRIVTTSGRDVEITGLSGPWPVRLDRHPLRIDDALHLAVLPAAIRLLI